MEVYRLEAGKTGSVRVARTPVQIEAYEGTLWVTQEGDPRDYFLEAGQKFVATRPGLTVVQAMKVPVIFSARTLASKPRFLRLPKGRAGGGLAFPA